MFAEQRRRAPEGSVGWRGGSLADQTWPESTSEEEDQRAKGSSEDEETEGRQTGSHGEDTR